MEWAIVVRTAIVVPSFEGKKEEVTGIVGHGVAATCVYLQLQQAWGRAHLAVSMYVHMLS